MGKQRGDEPPPLGSFSFGVTNDKSSDNIFITVGIPKIIDLPYIGHTTIESIGIAVATGAMPWLLWFGRRTVRRFQQYLKESRKKPEPDKKPESPVKAKRWESTNHKLEDFMNEEIAPARARLRKVEDPDTVEKRIEKRAKIKEEQSKKPKGRLGLSAELLQNSRKDLRQDPNANLASYLERKKDNERTIGDDLKMLETSLEEDIKKTRAQLVSVYEHNGKNGGDENEDDVESPAETASKCRIS